MIDNKLIITTDPKTFRFGLPKDAGINLKDEIDSIIKHNKRLAQHTIKNEVGQLLCKYRHGNETQKTVKLVNHTIFFLTCHMRLKKLE